MKTEKGNSFLRNAGSQNRADTVLSKLQGTSRKFQRSVYIVIGLLSLALGVVGIILPLLPTTPFLLLSAALFAKTSPRLYHWLHTNQLFGEYLRRYRDKEGIPIELKIGVLSILWITLISSALFAVSSNLWYVRIILLGIGIGVTIHILKIRTQIREKDQSKIVAE